MSQPIPQLSSSQSGLEWFELVFYAVALPFTFFNVFSRRSNIAGLIGWFFLNSFCLLKLVGFILLKTATSESMLYTGSIIANASTASIFLSLAAIFHEAAQSHKSIRPFVFGRGMQILFHLLIGGSIGMLLAGAVNLFTAIDTPAPTYARPLIIVGIVSFMTDLLILGFMVVSFWRIANKSRDESLLLKAVAAGLPLLLIQLIYLLVGAADNSASWNLETGGPLGAEIVMQVVPQVLLIFELTIFGIMTRKMHEEPRSRVRV